MIFLILNAWTVIVRGQSGQVIAREEVEESSRAVAIAEKYVSQGYSVYIERGEDGAKPLSFVEGNTNVVTSVNAGPGIEVNSADPSSPMVSVKTSCSSGQVLVWNGSDWVCQNEVASSSGGDYTGVSMLSLLYGPSHWDYALEYCANLDSLGYNDWRLPTPSELAYLCKATGNCDTSGKKFYTVEAGVVNSSSAAVLAILYTSDYGFIPTTFDYNDIYFYCVR